MPELRILASGLFWSAVLVAVLAIPGLRYAYVYDDYSFLGRAQTLQWADLAPNSSDVFYRPVSREMYFGFLERVMPESPILGHVLNLVILVAIVVIGGTIVTRLAGPRAGMLAAALLALFGHWPLLVAWVSGAQDLLAILFVLLALRFELNGSRAGALAMFGLAILSKETAVVLAPALVATGWLCQRGGRAVLSASAQFGGVVVAWMLVHPGFRDILLHRGTVAPGSYIGLDNSNRWNALLQSIPGLLNLPLTGNPTPWPTDLTWIIVVAFVPFLGVLWTLRRQPATESSGKVSSSAVSTGRLALFGIVFGLPPLLLTCLLVRHWVPYYLCFSTFGVSLLLVRFLRDASYPTIAFLLVAYLVGGVWSRGVVLPPGMPSERSLVPAGVALKKVEANFKKLEASLPPNSVVYVSTMVSGDQSVYLHLHHLQALRVWYREPTIETLRPELQVAPSGQEFLFWINPDLEVCEVDLRSLSTRTSGGPISHKRYRSTLRSYAFGLAGAGRLQRAIDVLLSIDGPETWDYAVTYRMVATLLFAYGDPTQAQEMLEGVPELPRMAAFESVGNILTIPTPGVHLEQAALEAFGFSWRDADVIRRLLRALMGLGHHDVSERIAHRLLEIAPGDPEAMDALKRIRSSRGERDQIIPPVRRLTVSLGGPTDSS